MLAKTLAAVTAAEGLIVAAVIGIGAEFVAAGSGVLAFGLAWYLPLIVDRVRRRSV